MGEFSAVNGIKSIVKDIPSFCVRGIKLSEHLGDQLKRLNIDIKGDAEMDIINIIPNGYKVNIIFGECKVCLYFIYDIR